ncbi:MAG: hypothetical protein EBU33_07425 [Sphingobacteriia bacterium]|jgi:hypothetical protein|nr:hypothetical protein [Sphingobacteriia bacterium]
MLPPNLDAQPPQFTHLHVQNFASNEAFREVFQLLHNELNVHPQSTRRELSDLVSARFPPDSDGRFVLNFDEARSLDHHFFATGNTSYWLRAYGYPEDISIRGIFTFSKDLDNV